jgi:carboxypeptidase PM20D1
MPLVRRLLAVLGGILAIVVTLVVARTALLESTQRSVSVFPRVPLEANALASRLGAALRFPTISHLEESRRDPEAFRALHAFLKTQFPGVDAALSRETIGELSLLYRWPGSDPAKPAALLAAHQDVVPVEPGTETDWEHPPFSGAVADGAIWGRGALDDKVNLLAQLEAVESLLAEGFEPAYTLYLAFGHDEEVGGNAGAAAIAATLAERGARLAFVLDEGGALTAGLLPGIEAPIAVVGVAEKGYVSFDLVASGTGGHSSMPPREQAVVLLAKAVTRIDAQRPEARLTPATRAMLETLAPEAGFGVRAVLGNLWLFEPLVLRFAAFEPSADALVRTTTAPTMLRAGIKDNVVPGAATATVNIRLLPGDTAADLERHLVRVIDDPRVEVVRRLRFREASRESALEGPAFEILSDTIRGVFPETIVTPYLVAGGTDARHYRDLSDAVYRFAPLSLDREDRRRLHGTNERVGVKDYVEAVHFYRALIQNLDALP